MGTAVFATHGTLLRILRHGAARISHVIIDEVHERSIAELSASATVRQVSRQRKLPTPGKSDRKHVDPAGDPTEQRIAATLCITSERKDCKNKHDVGDSNWENMQGCGPGLRVRPNKTDRGKGVDDPRLHSAHPLSIRAGPDACPHRIGYTY